jgi:hypothetical protein
MPSKELYDTAVWLSDIPSDALKDRCKAVCRDDLMTVDSLHVENLVLAVSSLVEQRAGLLVEKGEDAERVGRVAKSEEAALRNAVEQVRVRLRDVQMCARLHPDPWRVVACLVGRALRGELGVRHAPRPLQNVMGVMDAYLTPSAAGGAHHRVLDDAWAEQECLLGLE